MKTVTDAVRTNRKRQLNKYLSVFLEDATPEEVWFLHDVLSSWDSMRCGCEAELVIASAFNVCTNKDGEYLLVKDEAIKKMFIEYMDGKMKELPKPEPKPELESSTKRGFLRGCNADERVYCVRLIRVLRENCWIAAFVRAILDEEACAPYRWTIKKARQMLDNFDVLESLADNARRLGNNWSNHPICRAIRKEWGEAELQDYKTERHIRSLIESVNKEKRNA